ncbi:MAG: TonB-dependent receptor [Candidatus Eremiobacteraeota bacterium]|nr:TonB-dependent receptor [Candidatus Eremiobacteraeota bacterium]
MLVLAAVVAALASPSPSPSPTPLPIGSVTVVSGSPQSLHRAPQAASVLDLRSLRTTTAPTLDQALRALPGFDRNRSNAAFTNYGQLRLSFAGAGADRGALLVDGVPAQDGFGGQVDWNAFPTEAIARAEVLRGPGSALYGSGAIGGVLSLTTLAPSNRVEGVLDASAGGVDRSAASFGSTGPIGPLASSIYVGTRRLAYGVIPPGQTTAVDQTAIGTADVAQVRLRRSTARTTLDVSALESDDAQQDGRPNDGFSRALRQAAATYVAGTRATLALTAFGRDTTVVNLADMPTAPGKLLYTQHVPSSDAGLRARWDVPVRSGAYALVAERRLVTGRSDQLTPANAVQSDVSGTQMLDGVALQRTWDGRFGAIAGARYDAVRTQALGERHEAALSPRVALRYDASPAIAVRAAFGTGLRAPFLNELVRSFRVGQVLERNNPALVPERSRSAQLGFDVASAATRFAFDYTATRVRDAIGFATIAPNVQQRANFGRTATDAYTAEYQRGGACRRVRAFATAQHDRVVVGSPAQIGKRLAYVPDSAASLDAERTVGSVTGALELSYSGPTFSDDLEKQPLGTAFLIGGRLTLHGADGTALSLAVDNLADKVYLTSVDRLGPPASVTLRLTVPVGARPRATPAAGCG